MPSTHEASAQAIFIRTDSPEYLEEKVHVQTLTELIEVCSQGRPHCVLDRVLVSTMKGSTAIKLVLEFVSVSEGN